MAADIWLPKEASPQEKLPVIISFTRYWRNKEFSPKKTERNYVVQFLNDNGYAVVVVDVRGTGASFGHRMGEFTVQETRDFGDIFDWVVKQPWSNRNIATLGISYTANTAEHASFLKHPSLKAIVPRFADYDWYRSLVFPGGFKNNLINSNWGDMVWAMDLNQFGVSETPRGTPEKPAVLGVRPVDEDGDKKLLKEAIEQHKNNINVADSLKEVDFRDDKKMASHMEDNPNLVVTPYLFNKIAEEASVPAYHWAGWGDSGTAAGVLARFFSSTAPGIYTIGPWNHGARQDINPFKPKNAPVQPPVMEQYQQIIDFLDPYMKNNSTVSNKSRELRYFTMGENAWKTTETWPPLGINHKILYLNDNHKLSDQRQKNKSGADDYVVDYDVGTGPLTRWSTQLEGGDVYYSDRKDTDKSLLVYDTAPLDQDTEITGTPVVDLYLSSTHKDGGIIAYLEMITPDGIVIMITEGSLRFIHRRISDDVPPYASFGPYHSFEKKDAMPMRIGKVEKISFSLLPTSILIPKGYALRLALAGHDKDTFVRIPDEGQPTLTLQKNAIYASSLSIPIISKPLP